MVESGDDTVQTLFNMMNIVDDFSYDFNYAATFVRDPFIEKRNYSVSWMKQVSFIEVNDRFAALY